MQQEPRHACEDLPRCCHPFAKSAAEYVAANCCVKRIFSSFQDAGLCKLSLSDSSAQTPGDLVHQKYTQKKAS
jgi:hypothetical protein